MKWKFNIRKEIVISVPFEVEADNFVEALKKGQEYLLQERMKDKDPENTEYLLDTTPSADQIPRMDESKREEVRGKKSEG